MSGKKENSGMRNKEIVKEVFEGGISYTLGLQLSGKQPKKEYQRFCWGETINCEKHSSVPTDLPAG